jgi:hypothetical protein
LLNVRKPHRRVNQKIKTKSHFHKRLSKRKSKNNSLGDGIILSELVWPSSLQFLLQRFALDAVVYHVHAAAWEFWKACLELSSTEIKD